MPLLFGECYTCGQVYVVVHLPPVISLDDDEKRLPAEAHAIVREGQRRLHAVSEEARLLYQQRLGEWEQCRHALEEMAVLLNTQTTELEGGRLAAADLEARAGLLQDESVLREKHGELAERVYRIQRVARLLAASIRQLEKESARLLPGGDGLMQTQGDESAHADSHERIIQAHEQERLRLAREIHDGPAQILANAIFELEYFERLVDKDPSAVKEQFAQLKGDIRDGLAEVRRCIFDLRPPALGDMGLFAALRRYLTDFERHFGIPVETDLPESKMRLPTLQEVTVFRVVQEALQNIQKHACASKVAVKGEMDGAGLKLSIEDNGRGFDLTEVASRHSKNLGLISMRERAGLIDARLHIGTAPGRGTRITLTVPLERDTE